MAATGVDALAVAVGSSHAMTTRTARLDHDADRGAARRGCRCRWSCTARPACRPTSCGARWRPASTKINVGTALNLAMTAALRDTLAADPDVTDPRRYLAPARLAMRDAVLRILDEMG